MPSKLISIGISHHSVPVELREKVTFSPEEIRAVLSRLKDAVTDEALLISTCNRTELYVRPSHEDLSSDYLIDFLLEAKGLPAEIRAELKKEFSKLSYCEAIIHLFEVSAGIDSQILGDQQIFGQIKESFRIAEEIGATGTFMTKLAHASFHVAKRVRSETQLTEGANTISYAAVEFAKKVYDDFRTRSALIIGAGETAELAISYLIEKKIGRLYLANRTEDNSKTLLDRLSKQSKLPPNSIHGLSDIQQILGMVDIVISSTGSNDLIIRKADVERAMAVRKSSVPLVMIDIAVPRDIDPTASNIPNVFVKDIDDLSLIINQNQQKRQEALPLIRDMINEEFENFLALFTKLEVGPTIAGLRNRFEQIRLEELERNKNKLSAEEFRALDEMTRKMVNRLLHTPTVMLKEPRTTKDDMQARIQLVRLLFALDQEVTAEDHE